MKKFIISLLIVAAFVAIPVSVFAQVQGTTLTTDAKANVVEALTITANSGGGEFGGQYLNFGSIAHGSTGGAVILTPTTATAAGSRTTSGSVDLIGSEASCALYTITGTPGSQYTVTLPSGDITLTGSGSGDGTNTMTLNTFSIKIDDLAASALVGTLTSGTSNFAVGGTLSVAADQNPGAYAGTFPVIVAYN